MAENSKIEWTTHTFNPWIGCQKVSPGCDNCYAESMSNRYGWTTWGPHGVRKRTSEANWKKPRQWAKAARATGERPRVFCASLADWLDNQAPEDALSDLYDLIHETPELDWLLLTKRPENFAKRVPQWAKYGCPANVWLGVTCEDQERAAKRIPILLSIRATVRFLSCEPMLSEIDLYHPHANWATNTANKNDRAEMVDWVICGGESGPGARMMQQRWAEHLRDQCATAGVAFFMKQMTSKKPVPEDLLIRQFPAARSVAA